MLELLDNPTGWERTKGHAGEYYNGRITLFEIGGTFYASVPFYSWSSSSKTGPQNALNKLTDYLRKRKAVLDELINQLDGE